MGECRSKKHWLTDMAYLYTTKQCFNQDKKGTHKVPCINESGSHDTYTCTICWKPVALDHGMYWFVPEREIRETMELLDIDRKHAIKYLKKH